MGDILSKLDEIDKKILNLLQDNARITNANIAKEIGLSPGPTLERVKKLEKSGLILRYKTELNKSLLGLDVGIFIMASLSGSRRDLMESFSKKIHEIPEIVECHHVTGSADFLLKVLTKDIQSYNKFISDRLLDLEEVANLQSMVVLSTIKEENKLPIN